VNATSFAVIGCPSDHFTPERILNVQVSLSSDVVHDSASPGSVEKSCWLYAVRKSKLARPMSVPVRVIEMKGLSESTSWVTPTRRIFGLCAVASSAPAGTRNGPVTRADASRVAPIARR
jgi:hypothetical protein